jgi:hypothetical protein
VVRKGSQEEPTECASEAKGAWIALAILETPGSKIVWSKIVGEETIASGQSDGVAENGTTDSVSWAKSSAVDEWFSFLSLETDIELKVVDIAIQQLSCASNFRVRIPLEEGAVC